MITDAELLAKYEKYDLEILKAFYELLNNGSDKNELPNPNKSN